MRAKASIPIFLGMDAGGSKTDVLICNAVGEILAKAKSGCGNHQKGRETAEENINSAVEDALKQTNLQKKILILLFLA